MSKQPTIPVNVFCSCAQEDEHFLVQLEKHLGVLLQSRLIVTRHRHKVSAGRDWQYELDHALDTVPLILLLISHNFISSEDQYKGELPRAMKRFHN
ncbi:MAG: hypothetical protein JO011_08180, partial [Ktedonobacteraceae bacterium]|nr:hypothetical protein [Ktedonobacteraceae bacterium]